jgi:hypothetical protein
MMQCSEVMMAGGLFNRRRFLNAIALVGIGTMMTACNLAQARTTGKKLASQPGSKSSVKVSTLLTATETTKPTLTPTDTKDTTPPP